MSYAEDMFAACDFYPVEDRNCLTFADHQGADAAHEITFLRTPGWVSMRYYDGYDGTDMELRCHIDTIRAIAAMADELGW